VEEDDIIERTSIGRATNPKREDLCLTIDGDHRTRLHCGTIPAVPSDVQYIEQD
jgi:hypothetical protein